MRRKFHETVSDHHEQPLTARHNWTADENARSSVLKRTEWFLILFPSAVESARVGETTALFFTRVASKFGEREETIYIKE